MARLNEPPVSTDSLETLRKKLLRQNRDLAKSNNIRALKVRELENDCAIMLSENLQLRSRILELEKEVENNEARRIADHALVIKEKIEEQLTEWATLLAGLGLEPPPKRHSPRIERRTSKPRISFSASRPSPSQRRLRDIARDIEELGHISETKSYPRMSLNPEQILALRSEADCADSAESSELGSPPVSQFIEVEPVKVDSPSRAPISPSLHVSPKIDMKPPEVLSSPQHEKVMQKLASTPKKKAVPVLAEDVKPQRVPEPEKAAPPAARVGSKRKLAARDDLTTAQPQRPNDENQPPRVLAGKPSIREKAGGKTLKELASMRKEARDKAAPTGGNRKPLAAKNSNEDFASPKKNTKSATDEVAVAKADFNKSKVRGERTKSKDKKAPITIEAVIEPSTSTQDVVVSDLGAPLTEPALLSPSSPEPLVDNDARGGTPPPADVNATREPSRPSRRNRTAVSYAEPNLRDKMRRPTKELCDAVVGEGKYARRSSHAEPQSQEQVKPKRESDIGQDWRKLPLGGGQAINRVADNMPASPLANRGASPTETIVPATEKGEQTSSLLKDVLTKSDNQDGRKAKTNAPPPVESPTPSEVDIYEFTTSSPHSQDNSIVEETTKPTGRRSSRRVSSALQSSDGLANKERASSRRRSMML